jgi:DNA-binding NtrC family response regulator
MRKRILVVDDDQSIRDSLQKVLQEAGYQVVLAAGGLEAGMRFEPEQIDLVLLDLGLPNQSGWDVFEALTTRYPFVPVIILTGLPNQYRTAVAAGVGALFEKPVEVPALLSTMERLLAEPSEVRLRRLCGDLQDTRYAPPVGARAPAPQDKTPRRVLARRLGSGLSPGRRGTPS